MANKKEKGIINHYFNTNHEIKCLLDTVIKAQQMIENENQSSSFISETLLIIRDKMEELETV